MKKILLFTSLLTLAVGLSTFTVQAKLLSPSPSKSTIIVSSKSPSKVVSKKGAPTPTIVKPSSVVYKKSSPTVKVVRTLPASHIVVKKGGISYYVSAGRYYRHDAGRYIAVAPPIGLRVSVLPVGYVALAGFATALYYYDGVYYQQSGSSYEVVDAPNEVTVSTLPVEADQVTIDGKEYYIYDGKIYSIVLTPDGKAFKVVGNLEN
ncbi:MAG: DUF6515 family protein [Rikenellaceae bacterium]